MGGSDYRAVSTPARSVDKVSAISETKSLQSSKSDKYADFRDHPHPAALRQSTIYDIIIETVYNEKNPVEWPKTLVRRIAYIIFIPLTHLQYITIPNPMAVGKENFYPLSLFMATVWIWMYCFVIVWFTFEITMAFNLRFSIMPLVIFPFGIALRDQKKFWDMRTMV